MSLLLAIFGQTVVFTSLSFGMYLNTKILRITDLAIDGSFLLGAATFTLCALKQFHPIISLICAALSGASVGFTSSMLQQKNKVQPIIAGILSVFLAHGAFFLLIKSPNVGLYGGRTLAHLQPTTMLIITTCILLLVGFLMHLLLNSTSGLALRTFGSNPHLLTQLGKNPESHRRIGLSCSNAAAGIAGALTAQQNGYADISMGFGIALIGIATVLIGQHFAKYLQPTYQHAITTNLVACFFGAFIYFAFITMLLIIGVSPLYLKSIFALALALVLHATSTQASST